MSERVCVRACVCACVCVCVRACVSFLVCFLGGFAFCLFWGVRKGLCNVLLSPYILGVLKLSGNNGARSRERVIVNEITHNAESRSSSGCQILLHFKLYLTVQSKQTAG